MNKKINIISVLITLCITITSCSSNKPKNPEAFHAIYLELDYEKKEVSKCNGIHLPSSEKFYKKYQEAYKIQDENAYIYEQGNKEILFFMASNDKELNESIENCELVYNYFN